MSDPSTITFLVIWYLLVAGFIAFFLAFFRLLNLPDWRSDRGDISTEVGYLEDAVGHKLTGSFADEKETEEGDPVVPHVQASANCGSGPF
ncbi:MAG: hypothetical protein K2Z81_15210 [Cyanobacteria bacterium]|nr:hypothetical protein [Cyanobacteriota bacterium]